MNKVIVTVFVPTLGMNYDIFIPKSKRINEATNLIINAIYELTNGEYTPKFQVLIDRKSGKILDKNMKISEINLQNNSNMLLL